MGFPKDHFTHVVIDEAGQATEPELMVVLTHMDGENGQIILAGDPMQLGPIVGSPFAEHWGYGESFLNRILQCPPYQRNLEHFEQSGGFNPLLVTRLTYNYRSVPEILKLASDMFYDSELIPQKSQIVGEDAARLQLLSNILPARIVGGAPSMVFHGVKGDNIQGEDSPSWSNKAEASQILLFVRQLYEKGIPSSDIGIITPYQKQVQSIRNIINHINIPLPKIGSVEEFQGQERSIVLLSTVRSSRSLVNVDIRHTLGFVRSPKRLNVSITRAKTLLVIFGNPDLLCIDENWCKVIKYCLDIGGYTGCDLPVKFFRMKEFQE